MFAEWKIADIPKQLFHYQHTGGGGRTRRTRRRSTIPGRPLKRLLDGYNREAEKGHLLS
jgi:hypothetical protein